MVSVNLLCTFFNVREVSRCFLVLGLFFVQEPCKSDNFGIDRFFSNRTTLAVWVRHDGRVGSDVNQEEV